MRRIDLVVIGASAGGVEALCRVVKDLPADFGAAVLIVMHIGESSSLPSILNRCGTLPCRFVADNPVMERGHVYIAPPHYHMRVEDGKIALSQGPRENLRRPSIDPLFRSASRLYRDKVVGIILTGALDDGSAGLFAIKSRGGITIVQDPDEAFQPSMPAQALRHTKIDYRLPIRKIAPLLVRLVGRSRGKNFRIQPSAAASPAAGSLANNDHPFPVSCPECQGPLFQVKEGKENYFHCRIGHAYSGKSLNEAHDEALERALWTSIRTLGEKIILHKTMEQKSKKDPQRSRRLRETIEHAQKEIDLLKEILKNL
jgi:two-component system, chemotaxis family, protein-glutamate methylesterase/glutaminase